MNASVIICTRDRPKDFANCIRSILAQSEKVKEIVVVDSSETNETRELVRRLGPETIENIKYIKSSRGLPLQRNIGLKAVNEDVAIIGFLDDDVVLESDYFEQVFSAFASDNEMSIVGISGNATNEKPRTIFDKLIRRFFLITDNSTGKLLRSGDAGHVFTCRSDAYVDVLSGCNMWFRHRLFSEEQLQFDETLMEYAYMEDQDFSIRARRFGLLVQLSNARLVHLASPTSRIANDKLFEMYIVNSFYLLKKNLSPNGFIYVCYGWRLVGKLVHATGKSVSQASLLPLRGWFRGIAHMHSIQNSLANTSEN